MKKSIDDVFDLVDKAIIFFASDNWVEEWKIQKGVFYFLWLYSAYKKSDFNDIIKKLEFEPDEQGPNALPIEGEIEGMIRDGYLDVKYPSDEKMIVKVNIKKKKDLLKNVTKEERVILAQVKKLLEKLQKDELMFFVYSNPYIPKQLKEYFISNTQIKRSLNNKKKYYIKRLLAHKIIDYKSAEKILSGKTL
jgi:hypothetical protein